MFPLRVRSAYSLLEGTAPPATLCRLARQHGYPGLALTDNDNLYGLWSFLAACRGEGLRPVVGAEISEPGSTRRVTCLVEDEAGYRSLCRLLSRRHAPPDFDLAAALVAGSQGLTILGDDLPLLRELWEAGLKPVADLGPQPTAAGRRLRNWARSRGVTAVATPASRIAGDDQRELYRLLRAIARNTTLSRLETLEPSVGVQPLWGPEVYRRRFAVWPEVVTATLAVAERCTFTGPAFGIGSCRLVCDDLCRQSPQLPLFAELHGRERRQAGLLAAMDTIRSRYGHALIATGRQRLSPLPIAAGDAA